MPSLMGANPIDSFLDIYLFQADSDAEIHNWKNVSAEVGHQTVQVDDAFWGSQGPQFTSGIATSYSFYFALTIAGSATSGISRLSTWTAVRE